MSLSDAAEGAILDLVFMATAWANYADDAASSPETAIAVSLHTGDPGDAGTMSTSEVAYTSYARASVTRDTDGWTRTDNSISPDASIDFPAGTGGSGTVTYFGLGKTGGGAAALICSGAVSPSITCGDGITPRLTTATAITIS